LKLQLAEARREILSMAYRREGVARGADPQAHGRHRTGAYFGDSDIARILATAPYRSNTRK